METLELGQKPIKVFFAFAYFILLLTTILFTYGVIVDFELEFIIFPILSLSMLVLVHWLSNHFFYIIITSSAIKAISLWIKEETIDQIEKIKVFGPYIKLVTGSGKVYWTSLPKSEMLLWGLSTGTQVEERINKLIYDIRGI